MNDRSPSLFYQAKDEREHWREVCDYMSNPQPQPTGLYHKEEKS